MAAPKRFAAAKRTDTERMTEPFMADKWKLLAV